MQMETQWAQQEKLGLQAMGDTDEFKRILTDTNPYLLGITALVSVLHMIFDFLAFKVAQPAPRCHNPKRWA